MTYLFQVQAYLSTRHACIALSTTMKISTVVENLISNRMVGRRRQFTNSLTRNTQYTNIGVELFETFAFSTKSHACIALYMAMKFSRVVAILVINRMVNERIQFIYHVTSNDQYTNIGMRLFKKIGHLHRRW